MSANGQLKSSILAPDGMHVPSATWSAPGGQSPYFGWMGQDGLSTVRIESIKAMWPNAQRSGQYVMLLENGANMLINAEDAFRLMRRMGWSQPQGDSRA